MERKLQVTKNKEAVNVALRYGKSGRFIEFTLKEANELRQQLNQMDLIK